MVCFRFISKGAGKAKSKFYNGDQGRVHFDAWLGDHKTVSKVFLHTQVYKHKGSQTSPDGALMPETVARVGAMEGAICSQNVFFRPARGGA